MPNDDWTDAENDVIVTDYFGMLTKLSVGAPLNKAEHNRALQARIDRSKGSIEFKHRNISAIVKGLGEDWLPGYLPAFNFQDALVEAVARWLARHRDWLQRPLPIAATAPRMAEDDMLWIGPPPSMGNAPPPLELEQMTRLATRFDVAVRDAHNRALGRAGEELALRHERAILTAAGRRDLVGKVRWVADEDGDGAGYDIASFTPEGRPRLIEVKTTNGWERTPFHISRNELAAAEARRSEWCLMRIWQFSSGPKAFQLLPPLNAHVSLTPTSFMAAWN